MHACFILLEGAYDQTNTMTMVAYLLLPVKSMCDNSSTSAVVMVSSRLLGSQRFEPESGDTNGKSLKLGHLAVAR